MIVRLGDIINKVSQNVDRYNTPLQYYIGKGLGECGELALTEKGDLKKDVETLGYQFQFEFHKGDTLFFTKSHHLRKAGYVDFDGVCSIATFVLRSKDSSVLLPEYLPIIIHNDVFWDYCVDNESGSVNTFVRWSTLADYEFDLPSIEEQKVLADKLWAAYKVKESYRQLLSTTDEMLKAKFQEMFGDAEKNGTISDLVENNIASVKKTYKNEDTIAYIDISSVSAESNKVLDVTNYVVKQAPSRAQQCVRKGDILVSTTRPLNRNIAVVESDASNLVASTGFCVLRPKNGWSDYVMAIVKSDEYTEAMCDKATGGVYPAVNNSDVLSYNINIPSPEILQQISLIFRQAEATKASLRASIEAIDRVIKSLINQ